MELSHRIDAFAQLGQNLLHIPEADKEVLYHRARAKNAWFTFESIDSAFAGLQLFLQEDRLKQWTAGYGLQPEQARRVGLVMAGNIPMVGFHDFLSVLISGHHVLAKTSHQDPVLIPWLAEQLVRIAPEFGPAVTFAERLNGMEAVIATGSNNSSRYFDYYFSKYPHIIRKNRTSVAVLSGQESAEELAALGRDIFAYFGLGCRNVSKFLVPPHYDFKPLLDALQPFAPVLDHHKYSNNYDYYKSIYLVNQEPHLDTGFLLLKEEEAFASPLSVVYYQTYRDEAELALLLAAHREQIQCTVAAGSALPDALPPGQTQEPELWDYADGVDTLAFLDNLN